MDGSPAVPPGVDTSIPTSARIYDYMLGGRNYFDADERACQKLLQAVPDARDIALANRGFHQRAAKWIAEHGITQYIDIGSGLPTVGNTHEIVQKIVPSARVVYVDKDPMVVRHSQALVEGSGTISVICADLRDPDAILDHPDLCALIDFSQPVALMMTAVFHFVGNDDDPLGLLARYLDVLPSGSYFALSHLTSEWKPSIAAEGFRAVFDTATEHMYYRTKAELEQFFEGLELMPPYDGAAPHITFSGLWGCEDPKLADSEGSRWLYCGVARKP